MTTAATVPADLAAQVRASVRELPPLPEIVMELLQSLGNESTRVEDLARRIGRDAALAGKTLRLANSSIYGMSRRIDSVGDATAILGFRTLRSIVAASGLAQAFPPTRCAGFDLQVFWRHSLGTALCAHGVAAAAGRDENAAFTVGLLHDIGHLVLASSFPEAMAAAIAHRRERDCPTIESERAVLGTDHGELGAMVAEHWQLPSLVSEAIRSHHEPLPPSGPLGDIVHVADNIAHALELSGLDDDAVPLLSMSAWLRLDLQEAACRAVFRQVTAEHAALCSALSI